MESIPNFGLGTYKLEPENAYKHVLDALELGYRHIDTAHVYKNEEAVGRAIRDSGVPREQIWVTTKIWKRHLVKDQVDQAVDLALEKLGLDYVDLVLIHSPCKNKKGVCKATSSYLLLEKYRENYPYRVRFIGVSNYTVSHLTDLEKVWTTKPFCNQIELSPFCRREELVSWCLNRKIGIVAHSSLTRGEKFNHHVIGTLAYRNGVSPSQVMLAWARAKKFVIIPGVSETMHLIENWECREFNLDDDDVTQLDNIGEEYALFPWFL
jgi:diketogulonate reductase-like aldo/keto reductase